MDRQNPPLQNRLVMLPGGIALVLLQTVAGVLLRQAQHHPVPADLGQDGGRRNGSAAGIPFDDGPGLQPQAGVAVAIHQRKLRLGGKHLHRPAHGQKGGLQDVEPVDFLRAGVGDAIAESPAGDFCKESLAFFLAELFGIIETLDLIRRI